MSYAAQIKAAKSPQEGMALLAQGIDAILAKLDERPAGGDGWGEWSAAPADSGLLTVEEDEDGNVTVVLAGVSDEKYAKRRAFAENVLQLHHHIDSEGDIIHAYGLGGPLWLYTGNRELFTSYPPEVMALMVQDVEEDDVAAAYDMGKDVLKDKAPGQLPTEWAAS